MSERTRKAELGRVHLVALLMGALLLSWCADAQAAPGCSAEASECPPFLGQLGSFGSAAGQMKNPRVAADPNTGHVFVLESGNRRVSEFDAEDNWSFVKAWGWGVLSGVPELQTCTAETGCMAGLAGTGAGQIEFAFGITLDEEGNIWTLETFSRRAQKFSPAGEFLLMVGGEVNKTKVEEREEQEANAEPVTVTEAEENLCTAASGDKCGEGVSGTGAGQFSFPVSLDAAELGSSGIIYVGDENRILEFAEDGTYEGDIALPGAGSTEALAVAPDGSLYVISSAIEEAQGRVIREVGPAGEEIRRLKSTWEGRTVPKNPLALAVDAEENVYVSGTVTYEFPPAKEGDPPLFKDIREVLAFEPDGNLISFELDKAGFGRPSDDSNLVSLATNVVKGTSEPGEVLVAHFFNGSAFGKPSLSYIRVYGRSFAVKEEVPVIEDQYAVSVASEEATVEGLINPKFTTDTTYQLEYGTSPCEPAGCEFTVPAEPASLGGGAVNTSLSTGPIALSGLDPGTTYHFRFSAENKVTNEEGAGPVFGEEGSFTTYITPVPPEPCPNDELRLGPAARLPDCRAYEMVSPVDKQGGQALALRNVVGFPSDVEQAALAGEGITYSSYRAFSNPTSSPYTSQYIARRDPASGWGNEPISPPREGISKPNLDSQYKLFSPDLTDAWLVTDSEPALEEGAIAGQRNLYRRENGTGAYQVQCPAAPLEAPAEQFLVEPQGASADGSHVAVWANARLLAEAAPTQAPQLYECVDGEEMRLVSVLPGGGASPTGGSAGTDSGGILGFGFRENNVAGAVSADGSRIFWTAGSGPGPLYVRIDGTETVQIAVSGARFRTASPAGDRVIYSVGGNLLEAAVEPGAVSSTQIASEVLGFMGASEDAQLVYFVSREDLDGNGPAQAGEPNLYLYRSEGDSDTFIAILAANDAREAPLYEETAPILTPVARAPYNRSSRVSADGLHAAFTSSAPLTGYDNTDQKSGEADTEVFLYDAASEELLCASCNPGGARPRGANAGTPTLPFWAAAKIPGWANQFHASRVLAPDGSRLFFEATDPLALGDTNATQDVYQWEEPGTGTCTEASDSFSPTNGGCIELISTGKSKSPSEIVDASASGGDVFFKTFQGLWPLDPNALDIYDARVGGGFSPPDLPEECEGSSCQPSPPAPQAQSPSSSAYVGPGNLVEEAKPKPKKCRKGTHKVKKAGKTHCVKNKAKGGKANKSGRAGR